MTWFNFEIFEIFYRFSERINNLTDNSFKLNQRKVKLNEAQFMKIFLILQKGWF